MFSKYKIIIWNSLCLTAVCIPLFFIYPYLFQKSVKEQKEQITTAPLKENDSIRKVWKRGKYPSITTIIENSSSSNLNEEKSHSSDDWVSITWSKKNDP